jgi:S-adenosylmethionine hydrolase
MSHNIITLTTDWGSSDNYAAIFKAHLYRENPNVKVVDITHDVKKNAVTDAAFLVRTMYHYFPKNSIHIIDVNFLADYNETKYRQTLKTEHSTENLHFTHYLAFRYDEHYFMCENNGMISSLCKIGEINKIGEVSNINEIEEIVRILPNEKYKHFSSFKAIPYWVNAAVRLATGENLLSIGEKYDKKHLEPLKESTAFSPPMQKDKIVFHGQYIDNYGNIITNLSKSSFDEIANGRTTFDFYCIQLGTQRNRRISTDYNDKLGSQFILLFGHSRYLEIAVKYAPFAKILRAESLNLEFTINFLPQTEK